MNFHLKEKRKPWTSSGMSNRGSDLWVIRGPGRFGLRMAMLFVLFIAVFHSSHAQDSPAMVVESELQLNQPGGTSGSSIRFKMTNLALSDWLLRTDLNSGNIELLSTDLTRGFHFTQNGELGIGIADPDEKLEILGNIALNVTADNLGGSNYRSSGLILSSTIFDSWKSGAIYGTVGNPNDISDSPGGLAFYTKPKGSVDVDLEERMRIDYQGNVGIGTDSPTEKLDVAGTVKATAFILDDGSQLTGSLWSGDNTLASFVGRVGIGTAGSPSAGLEVKDGINTRIRVKGDNNTDGVDFGLQDHRLVLMNRKEGSDIDFLTNDGSITSKVKIKSNGQVGIGTALPDAQLHVEGSGIDLLELWSDDGTASSIHGLVKNLQSNLFELTGTIAFERDAGGDITKNGIGLFANKITIGAGATPLATFDTHNGIINFSDDVTIADDLIVENNFTVEGDLIVDTDTEVNDLKVDGVLTITPKSDDLFAIKANGPVHISRKETNGAADSFENIDVDALDHATLFVEDGIVSEDVIYTTVGDNWPDYVFEEDYELHDLGELEDFIIKHKHLPGVISQLEVKEKGLVSGKQMTITLLEKVEELTLYTIQQHKALQEQQAYNAALLERLDALEVKVSSARENK
ncbi:MAG: hypothetical protein R8G66_07830 [Cytophagales bacterium]|nr:hypothetical protein [Cytophagales bacterium]